MRNPGNPFVESQLFRGYNQCYTLRRYYENKNADDAVEHFEGGMRALGLLASWLGMESVLEGVFYDEELIRRHEKEQGIA